MVGLASQGSFLVPPTHRAASFTSMTEPFLHPARIHSVLLPHLPTPPFHPKPSHSPSTHRSCGPRAPPRFTAHASRNSLQRFRGLVARGDGDGGLPARRTGAATCGDVGEEGSSGRLVIENGLQPLKNGMKSGSGEVV